jgi:Peptidase A4 family
MSTSGLGARVRTFMDKVDKYGFLPGAGRRTRPLRAAATAGVAALAAAAALALVAACGGGAAAASGSVPVSLSRTTLPPDGAMTRVSRGLEQGDEFTETGSPWAGYVIHAGQDVENVSGEWTVPTLDCQQTPNALLGVWAGIGGVVPPQALLQTGIEDKCVDGAQQDQAWWELADTYKPVNFAGLPVSPGDQMQASVYLDPSGQWVTRIDDLTTGLSGWMVAGGTWGVGQDGSGSFTTQGSAGSISYAGGSTVEWVVEAPGLNPGAPDPEPMPDFGTVQFSDLQAGLQSWSLNPNEALELSYGGRVLAEPGQPDGDGFSVSYTG